MTTDTQYKAGQVLRLGKLGKRALRNVMGDTKEYRDVITNNDHMLILYYEHPRWVCLSPSGQVFRLNERDLSLYFVDIRL